MNNLKNKIKCTNTLSRDSAMCFFKCFVEGCDPCLLTSYSVLYTRSCEVIKLC